MKEHVAVALETNPVERFIDVNWFTVASECRLIDLGPGIRSRSREIRESSASTARTSLSREIRFRGYRRKVVHGRI